MSMIEPLLFCDALVCLWALIVFGPPEDLADEDRNTTAWN